MNMETALNYKDRDKRLITGYMTRVGDSVEVTDILEKSGAERMRVYPIIQEMILEGQIEVIETEELGAPKAVKFSGK